MNWLNAVDERAKRTTVSTYWRHLRAWLNWLEAAEVLAHNPATTIKKMGMTPKAPRKRKPVAFTRQAMQSFLKFLDDLPPNVASHRDRTLIRFHYVTCCRSGEVATLRWADLELDNFAVNIDAVVAKDDEYRRPFFNRRVRADLLKWREVLEAYDYDQPWVFCQVVYNRYSQDYKPYPRPLTVFGIRQLFRRRLAAAELPLKKVHALRHSHALHALKDGIPINEVRDQLGHSHISVTQRYLDSFDEDRRDSYMDFDSG